MEQPPSIGCLVSPTHIPWVSPQQSYLIRGVASMPQSIPEVLTWARYGCHCLELQPWLGHCSERRGLPVGLLRLFPHDHIEAATVLVTEEEARIVIISDCVHVEGAFKVHAIKGRVPNCKTRVTVHSLNNFHALVEHYPVWIDLGVTLGIQDHSLIGPEVCEGNFCTLRAHIQRVNHCVIVKVIFTDITHTVAI